MKHSDMVDKSYFDFMMHQPFFGFLLSKINRARPDESIPTMATDGTFIIYNKDFVENMTQGELNFVFIHEIYHVILLHMFRRGARNPVIWNLACDYVVNANILADIKSLRSSGLDIEFYHTALIREDSDDTKKTAEQVYDELLEEVSEAVAMDMLNNSGTSQDLVDNYSSTEEQNSKAALVEAAEFAKSYGNTSDNVKRIIDDVTLNKLRWDQLLKRWLSLRESDDTSFDSPNRHYLPHGVLIPDTYLDETLPEGVIFAIDTSGSISTDQLSKFKAMARHAVEQYDVEGKLLYWDTSVQAVADMMDNRIEDIPPSGGGGTNPLCVFDFIKTRKMNPSAVVILTDGYFATVTQRFNNVIWVICEDGVTDSISKESGITIKL